MAHKPLWIVLEGPDGGGKTTLIETVKELLYGHNRRNVYKMTALQEGPIGKAFYRTLKSSEVSRLLEIFGMAASMAETYDIVQRLLTNGSQTDIVMDRWIPSYWAYQCNGRNSDVARSIYCDALRYMPPPDIYIHCKVSPNVAAERMAKRLDNNYLDHEVDDFKKVVSMSYIQLFNVEQLITGSRIIELDCDQPLDVVINELTSKLSEQLSTLITA